MKFSFFFVFFFHQDKLKQIDSDYFSFLVADPSVEFFPIDAQEVLSGVDDATLDGDGPGCVDVVPCHHADRDARTLTLLDGVRHLNGNR